MDRRTRRGVGGGGGFHVLAHSECVLCMVEVYGNGIKKSIEFHYLVS